MTTRGVARTAIFLDDEERRLFLHLLAGIVHRFDWDCHVFCLMTTHYHVVVETHLDRLSGGMQRLNGRYAQGFNRRHRREGHLFGERYASWIVETEEHLAAACAYVLDNSVRAGLCADAADWPWSGARAA